MKFSVPALWIIIEFAFCIYITVRARKGQFINTKEVRSISFLLFLFFAWTIIVIIMGVKGIHAQPWLLEKVPLLWQACVPCVILGFALFSGTLRGALKGILEAIPWHWLVLIQALRIGAIGGVVKGIQGVITSDFIFWVGIPDFLLGISALLVAWNLLNNRISNRFLIVWNLIGLAVILVPTFGFMNYWMKEPGFFFIFEFPMILAPAIVVPIKLSFNMLLIWGAYEKMREP